MSRETMRDKILDDYVERKGNIPKERDHTVPHDRNLEGFEMMFLKFIPADKGVRVLDIGCGCGQLLYMLRGKGYNNIKGIDIGQAQVDIARDLGIDTEKIDDLDDWLGKNNGWDVVIMSQVIEHFPKDKIYSHLDAIKKAMSPGGRVIIATPNMALLSGAFQRYIDFTHETGFTERSLREVLRICGFRDIEISGDSLAFRWRPKFLIWLLFRNIWFKTLGFIYLLERGTERPQVISRHLIAIARNG